MRKFSQAGRSWLKMIAFPVARPASDISESLRGIKRAWEQAEAIKQQKIDDAKSVSSYLSGKSPQEKFEQIYEANNWTEPELKMQRRAARNTRLASLAMVVFLLPILLWIVATSGVWVSVVVGIVVIVLCAAFCAQAMRFAWWEAQIDERSCFPMREFLSRRDIFKRVVRL